MPLFYLNSTEILETIYRKNSEQKGTFHSLHLFPSLAGIILARSAGDFGDHEINTKFNLPSIVLAASQRGCTINAIDCM